MKNIIKSFFYGKGQFQPVYFWITLLMFLIIASLIIKIFNITSYELSDTLILGLAGFVSVWVGLYNYRKKECKSD